MSTLAAAPRPWKKPPLIKSAWLRWSLGLGFALYLALALGTTEVNWARVWEGLPRGARFFAAFFPPDFTSRWSEIAEGIVESLWMKVISTVIGIAFVTACVLVLEIEGRAQTHTASRNTPRHPLRGADVEHLDGLAAVEPAGEIVGGDLRRRGVGHVWSVVAARRKRNGSGLPFRGDRGIL